MSQSAYFFFICTSSKNIGSVFSLALPCVCQLRGWAPHPAIQGLDGDVNSTGPATNPSWHHFQPGTSLSWNPWPPPFEANGPDKAFRLPRCLPSSCISTAEPQGCYEDYVKNLTKEKYTHKPLDKKFFETFTLRTWMSPPTEDGQWFLLLLANEKSEGKRLQVF